MNLDSPQPRRRTRSPASPRCCWANCPGGKPRKHAKLCSDPELAKLHGAAQGHHWSGSRSGQVTCRDCGSGAAPRQPRPVAETLLRQFKVRTGARGHSPQAPDALVRAGFARAMLWGCS